MDELKLPSGRTYDEDDIDTVRQMHKYNTIRYSETPFNLKAGGTSHVYFLGREDLTTHPAYLTKIAELAYGHLCGHCARLRPICLIGVPMAGGAIAAAMSVVNYIQCDDEQFRFLTMRPVLKSHGANNTWVDGKPTKDDIIVLVENVRTTGTSEQEALKRLAEDGIPTEDVVRFALVDRKLRPETATMKTLFYMADIITAFGHLGLWTPEQVEKTLPEFLQTE